MEAMMDFADLLKIHGYDPSDVRLARHPAGQRSDISSRITDGIDSDTRLSLYTLWRNNKDYDDWDRYIRTQLKKTFGSQKYVAHFMGLNSGDTVFTGLYELIDFQVHEVNEDTENPVVVWNHQKIEEFIQYEDRLIISWASTRAWSQIAGNTPKLVTALLKTFNEPAFPGFDEFMMMSNERGALPETWKSVLSATKGIYLLVHYNTGNQYIGSAYGEEGFYGRWSNYEDEYSGHGGNKLLRQLDKTIYQITILETCASSDSIEDIIAKENKWKEKLGSRAYGLNAN